MPEYMLFISHNVGSFFMAYKFINLGFNILVVMATNIFQLYYETWFYISSNKAHYQESGLIEQLKNIQNLIWYISCTTH